MTRHNGNAGMAIYIRSALKGELTGTDKVENFPSIEWNFTKTDLTYNTESNWTFFCGSLRRQPCGRLERKYVDDPIRPATLREGDKP
jgi:hypothetical protein